MPCHNVHAVLQQSLLSSTQECCRLRDATWVSSRTSSRALLPLDSSSTCARSALQRSAVAFGETLPVPEIVVVGGQVLQLGNAMHMDDCRANHTTAPDTDTCAAAAAERWQVVAAGGVPWGARPCCLLAHAVLQDKLTTCKKMRVYPALGRPLHIPTDATVLCSSALMCGTSRWGRAVRSLCRWCACHRNLQAQSFMARCLRC